MAFILLTVGVNPVFLTSFHLIHQTWGIWCHLAVVVICILTFPLISMMSSLSRWAGHWEGEIQDYWWRFGFCLRRVVWLL